jgi:hypothetical protein
MSKRNQRGTELSMPDADHAAKAAAVHSEGSGPRPGYRQQPIELLLAMRRHLHVAHHIPGRLRLRADAGLLELAHRWQGPRIGLAEAIAVIEGVRDVRINAAAATAVIDYEPASLPPDTWRRLLDGSDDAVLEILESHAPALDQAFNAAESAASAFG